MKLLPYITNFVKDASKAVKRIKNIKFKKTEESTLTELLGIPSLIVSRPKSFEHKSGNSFSA